MAKQKPWWQRYHRTGLAVQACALPVYLVWYAAMGARDGFRAWASERFEMAYWHRVERAASEGSR